MSNYEWEKQYMKQRVTARLREAELHRQAAEGQPGPAQQTRAPRRNNGLVAVLHAFARLFPARRTTN